MHMDFIALEHTGKQLLEQFPSVKRFAKRLYQGISYATSSEKITAEGNIIRVSPEDGWEYFYGYYDKSPWDATDRYILALRVRSSYRSVAPKSPGTIVLIDTTQSNRIQEIGITHAWNVQQGCMVQWLGPDFKSRILYNDFRNGSYCSVIYNVVKQQEEQTLPIPVYDVDRSGSFALSLDFSRLHRMRPGYGYSNLPDSTADILCPDTACIWKLELATGQVTPLFTYAELAGFEPNDSMLRAEHKVNHIMIRPDGKRFMLLHRWFQKGRKHTRLITVNIDKTELYNLSDNIFVSHCFWKNNQEILSFLRKPNYGDHYYLLHDQTPSYRILWPECNTDGHCSYSPDGFYVVTDTYPDRHRLASVYLCHDGSSAAEACVQIARVHAPFRYDNDCRCDLHPRWNHAGNTICIDSVHQGRRAMYILPTEGLL